MTPALVLVVEDNTNLREALVDCIQDAGFRALGAEHGESALELLHNHPDVSVILLDVVMPGMDARAFRRMQLTEARTVGIPVILMSAFAQPDDIAEELRAVSFLCKPFSIEKLLRELRTHCRPAQRVPTEA